MQWYHWRQSLESCNFFSVNLFTWRHFEINSFLEFKNLSLSGKVAISSFFVQTEVAFKSSSIEWCTLSDCLPGNIWHKVLSFQSPNLFWEFCLFFVLTFVTKRSFMVGEAFFKFWFCQTNVELLTISWIIIACHGCLVYRTFNLTWTVKGTRIFHSAVAHFWVCIFFNFVEDVFVVALYDAFDVFRAAITDFNNVAVENLVEFVLLRKMLWDEVKEFVTNLGNNIFVVGWIKPCYIAFPVFLVDFP